LSINTLRKDASMPLKAERRETPDLTTREGEAWLALAKCRPLLERAIELWRGEGLITLCNEADCILHQIDNIENDILPPKASK
jgi:hypothetical protein